MITIINPTTHDVQGSSVHTENWLGDGWYIVPPELEDSAIESLGYCVLDFDDDGNVVGLTPTERPVFDEVIKRTAQDDTDALIVDHEYRLTMLELGVAGEV